MNNQENKKLAYLDTVLQAIKKLGDKVDFLDLLNELHNKEKTKIIRQLISGGNLFLEKSLTHLEDMGLVSIHNPEFKGDSYKVSLTFEGELKLDEGGLVIEQEGIKSELKAKTNFHKTMPVLSILSIIISIAALSITLYFNNLIKSKDSNPNNENSYKSKYNDTKNEKVIIDSIKVKSKLKDSIIK